MVPINSWTRRKVNPSEMTLGEVAEAIRTSKNEKLLTRERVRQIEMKLFRRAREFLRRTNRQALEGEELFPGMAASVNKGSDRLTGRVGDENIFGSRFTVNRETEEQQQLFAGLGRELTSAKIGDKADRCASKTHCQN